MKLIVGLGNVGEEYTDTRHNIGFKIVEEISNSKFLISIQGQNSNFKFDKLLNAEIIRGTIGVEEIILVKPQAFMNNSGTVVRKLLNKYRIPTTNVIIIHDDLTIDPGLIKISLVSGSGQHNGVQSVIDALKTSEFIRVRCGIGRGQGDLKDMVLSQFNPEEKKLVDGMILQATDACISIVKEGVEKAMNRFN